MAVEIKPFNYANASKREYQAFNKCSNLLQAEKLPFDPPAPLADTTAQFQNVPDVVRLYFWLAWSDDANLIGFAFLALPLRENLRMAQFDIGVLPEYRHQGLGKQMLAEIVRTAKAEARDTLITNSNSNAAGGDAFLQHIGAEKGLETHAHQLHLAEIEKRTVSEWQQRSQERASGFELGWWLGPYPEEDLDAIVSLHQLLNQIPRGELDIEDFLIDARELRQEEKRLFTRGTERWTVYACKKGTGEFAGYSVTTWNPGRPDVVSQGITAVFPVFRNKGLGRWLKAGMLEKILLERPQAKFVRTYNADSNVPMLKINQELGFKPYFAETMWQAKREVLEAYLS